MDPGRFRDRVPAIFLLLLLYIEWTCTAGVTIST
jgi:hypothetical protein